MKDPAFLFYPGDWNLGTMHMTLIEKGAYIELLMLQFSRDKFTITQAKHMLNSSFDLVWATISEKFLNEGEFYWNERLKLEKEKRQKFTESRRNNALTDKKEVENKKDMSEHMPKRMEDENENRNIDYNRIVKSFNSICIKLSKVEKITESRKLKIKIRFTEIGGYEEIESIFKITSESLFLNGDNNHNWKATFDWIFENDKNWVKIKEGQYNNIKQPIQKTTIAR